MYYGSDEFNNIIDTPNGQALQTHLDFFGKTVDKVKSLKYYGGSNAGDDIAIGTTVSAYVEVTLYDKSDFSNGEFELLQSVQLLNGKREYMSLGFFSPRRPSINDEELTFTAHDRMYLFNFPYHSQLNYPATSDEVINEICEICGVELATPIQNPITIPGHISGYTCREMLGYIAGLHGCFACIDRFGRLNIRWYNSTPIEKALQLVYEFDKSQNNYVVELIKMIKNTETSFISGSGSVFLNYSNPYATQAFTDYVHSQIGGFTYRPSEILMLDDTRFDPWDIIKVVVLEDKEYLIPCMQIEHNFDDGTTRIQSVGATKTEQNYPFEGPMIQYLNRMAAELLTVNKLVANSVTVQYLEANYVATNQLDAVKTEIEEAVIGSVSADFADIRFANIDVANIDKTNIGLLFAEVGLLTSATIVEGHVTGFLNSVEINANSVTAGTLAVDRLVFRGSEKSIVYELNNITGALQTVQSDTLNGEILTNRSITVDKIVAKSITANEIAGKTITANEIMANSITGNEIAANSITADKLSVTSLSALSSNIGTITAGVIKSSNYVSGESGTMINLDSGKLITHQAELYGSLTTSNDFKTFISLTGTYMDFVENGNSIAEIRTDDNFLTIWSNYAASSDGGIKIWNLRGTSIYESAVFYNASQTVSTNLGSLNYHVKTYGGLYNIGDLISGDVYTVGGASLNDIYDTLRQSVDGKFILPNGLKICWGWTSTTNLNGYFRSANVTFPVTYNAAPTIFTTDWIYNQDVLDSRVSTSVRSYSTTSCIVMAKDPGGELTNRNVDINWIAIGY